MSMFGIGFPELIVIIIVALVVLGPSKLPELARSLGKTMKEFRRVAEDVKEAIETDSTDSNESSEKESNNQESTCAKSDKS